MRYRNSKMIGRGGWVFAFAIPATVAGVLKFLGGSFVVRFLFKASILAFLLSLLQKSQDFLYEWIMKAQSSLPGFIVQFADYLGLLAGFQIWFSIIMTVITYKFLINYVRSF